MKKAIFTAALIAVTTMAAYAQKDSLDTKAPTGNFDIATLTLSIASKLNTALELTKEQQPRTNGAVNTFLTGKSKIIHLRNSDKVAYAQKHGELSGVLTSHMQGILLQKQMGKFAGLKPPAEDASNVLWHLFY